MRYIEGNKQEGLVFIVAARSGQSNRILLDRSSLSNSQVRQVDPVPTLVWNRSPSD